MRVKMSDLAARLDATSRLRFDAIPSSNEPIEGRLKIIAGTMSPASTSHLLYAGQQSGRSLNVVLCLLTF